jgi:uncharacterized membrane protein
MRFALSTALLAATLFISPAFADDAVEIGSTPAQIRDAQTQLREAIEAKRGNYAHFTDEERREIFARQDDVLKAIEGRQSIDELNNDERVRLANALSAVDAAVGKAEDNRMICERIKPIGSNRPQNKCMTVGQRRQLREDAQRQGLPSQQQR